MVKRNQTDWKATLPDAMVTLLHEEGGFTWNMSTGCPVTNGVAVAKGKGHCMTIPLAWLDIDIMRAFVQSLGPIWHCNINRPIGARFHFGGWVQDDIAYLDVVEVISHKPEDQCLEIALTKGRDRGEFSVYDMTNKREHRCSDGKVVSDDG